MTKKQTEIEKLKREFYKLLKGATIVYYDAFRKDAKKYGFKPTLDFEHFVEISIGKDIIWSFIESALKTQREELVKEVKNMGFDMGIFEKWVSPAEIVEDLHKQVLQQLKEKDSDPLPVAKRKEIDVKKFMKIAKDLQKLEKEK